MQPHPIIQDAVETLCSRFDRGGYGLTPIVDLGALVANADGEVDEKEAEVLVYLFHALLGSVLTSEVVHHLIRSSCEVILEAGLEPRARFLAEILLDCDAVEPGLVVALGVAFASGGLSAPERGVITTIARAAEVDDDRLEALVAKVQRALESGEVSSATAGAGAS